MGSFKRIALFLFSLSFQFSILNCQRIIGPEIERRLNDYILNNYLPANKISGLGLTIVQNNGQVLYTTGYGPANIEKGIPNGNSTQFLIASITKSFTSLIVAKTLHEHFSELDESVIDTPIAQLIPQATFTLIDRFRSEYATFRDLLAHRLCIPENNLHRYADAIPSTDEIVFRMQYKKELCGIRVEESDLFHYSNHMYVIAGRLIAILAGKSYEALVEELLQSIGMEDTEFVKASDNFPDIPNRALPYIVFNDEIVAFNPELSKRGHLLTPAGGLFSTPNDMAKYLNFHINLGLVDGNQVVPKEVMEWLKRPAKLFPLRAFKQENDDLVISRFAYGLGFFVGTYDGYEMVEHGKNPPYISQMTLFPGKNIGIYSSTNMSPLSIDPLVLHTFIFELLNGNENAVEKAEKVGKSLEKIKNAEKERMAVRTASRNRAKFTLGNYGSGSSGNLEIYEKFNEEMNETGIYLEYGVWYKGFLETDGDYYRVIWDTDVYMDNLAVGLEPYGHIAFGNGTIYLKASFYSEDTFELGLTLDKLPVIPWDPESCGRKSR